LKTRFVPSGLRTETNEIGIEMFESAMFTLSRAPRANMSRGVLVPAW
jgi:hypothetical protein